MAKAPAKTKEVKADTEAKKKAVADQFAEADKKGAPDLEAIRVGMEIRGY